MNRLKSETVQHIMRKAKLTNFAHKKTGRYPGFFLSEKGGQVKDLPRLL